MPSPLRSLPRRWWSIDLPGYRAHPTAYLTYSAFDVDGLPPIERHLDDELEWLLAEAPVAGSLSEARSGDPAPVRPATPTDLDRLLGGVEVALPGSFEAFVRSPEPRRRIRSATACYLDLADAAVPVVGGGWLIHFLADQQWALHWSLAAGPNREEAVVASDEPFGYASEGYADDRPVDLEATDACVCAESFAGFLYRYWIENEIWFALTGQAGGRRPLTDEQTRYVEHYRS